MIDVWERLHLLFVTPLEVTPEIHIRNVSDQAMRQTLTYALQHSRDLEVRCIDFYEQEIHINAPRQFVDYLVTGENIGQIACNLLYHGLVIPAVGFFSDEPGFLTFDYHMGPHWTPIEVTALFEFFREIKSWDQNLKIELSRYQFQTEWCEEFTRVLETYLNEKS